MKAHKMLWESAIAEHSFTEHSDRTGSRADWVFYSVTTSEEFQTCRDDYNAGMDALSPRMHTYCPDDDVNRMYCLFMALYFGGTLEV
jgi:hypothetical protein